MPGELTADFPLFVGGMLAGICLFIAGFAYVLALPGSPVVSLAYGFAGLGVAFVVVGAFASLVLAVYRRD